MATAYVTSNEEITTIISDLNNFSTFTTLTTTLTTTTTTAASASVSPTEVASTITDHGIYDHPSLADYYLNLSPFLLISIIVGLLLQLVNVCIWLTTLSNLRKEIIDNNRRNLSIILCSLYPIICGAALITLLLPKLWLICNTIMHMSFTIGAVAFLQLCFNYTGISISSNLKERDNTVIVLSTPPCCCCCRCLPTIAPTAMKLCLLRYMVWQMPIIQGIIMLTLNVIYYFAKDLYYNVTLYFIPFIVCSILMGIWSINIIVHMAKDPLIGFNLRKKLLCLQLILILCKLQYVLLDTQLNSVVLGHGYPINHIIYKQTIINQLIMIEMVLVSMLVQNAYKSSPHITNG